MTREFCRGGSGGRRALAGIFDDRAKGVLVAEPREQEVPQRDKRRIGPLIKGQFRTIQPGGLEQLGGGALELAGGKAGAQQPGRLGLGRLGLLAAGLRLGLGGRLSGVGFGGCQEGMYYKLHTYHARPHSQQSSSGKIKSPPSGQPAKAHWPRSINPASAKTARPASGATSTRLGSNP